MGEHMTAVRRVLAAAGLVGLVVMASAGSAWADATPSADPSATASPAASPDPAATASPDPSPDASNPPTGTTDCGTTADGTGTPGLDPGVICQAGGINPGTAPSPTVDCGQVNGGVASPAPPGTVCIAGGLRPGTTSGSGTPSTLPRTGPAPLVPTLALGSWLLLLGMLAALLGRRRTAEV
ncbi:MAG: hypothetical protein QOI82_494 [Actinomycetota bacterium]|jgi:hypothetical protein|nr:hypothetical protein [Actinomycetota bacterium]